MPDVGVVEAAELFLARGWRVAVLDGAEKVVAWDAPHGYLAMVAPALVRALPDRVRQDETSLRAALWAATPSP